MGRIVFKGYDKHAKLEIRKTILSYIQELGIHMDIECGGIGECKRCLIKVDNTENLSPLTDAEREFISDPQYRLACQAQILSEAGDLYVEIPRRSYEILARGKEKEIPLDPLVRVVPLFEKMVCWKGKRLGRYEGEVYGIALDIGTTTLCMYCVDLETGDEVFVASRENPQMRYGSDVISRIGHAMENGQGSLEKAIRNAINEMISDTPFNTGYVYEIVVVGNSTMRDLFVGNPVKSLGTAPFEPFSEERVIKKAKELELAINPEAIVYALPLIGGFIGADAIGVILATEMYKNPSITMAIDIGTNTEIMIGNEERILATSCASGPAFEGSGIKWGVGGVEGAIKRIEIGDDADIKYETIGGLPPIGICGSGLIDALAQMLDRSIIDWRGRFHDGGKKLVIVPKDPPITITGEDVDKLNLAKSAISLGAKVSMRKLGVDLDDVEKLYLAGAFGNFIDTENAKKIGMIPEIRSDRIDKVGNAAVEGARQALISKQKREEIERILEIVEHVRLEKQEQFVTKFMNELYFQRYRHT